MRLVGDLVLAGLGQILNMRTEVRTDDPASPSAGQIWYNSTLGEFRTYDGTTVSSLALGENVATVQTELDATQAGAGLGVDGSYTVDAESNYLQAATSLHDATVKLDAQIKVVADAQAAGGDASAVQAELDVTQVGAGLNADGTYTAATGSTYLDSATSIRGSTMLLDSALADVSTTASAGVANALTAQGTADDAVLAAAAAQSTADAALPKSGGTMVGDVAFGGTHKITGLADAVNATDAVNKGQLDAAIAGLDFQADVEDVQTDATLEPVATIGKRYIITNEADLHAGFGVIAGIGNGDIVEHDGSEFVVVYDVSVSGPGAMVWNRAGQTFWYYNTTWAAFGGLSGIEAGVGLNKAGNVLSVALGAGVGQLPTNEVGLDLHAASGLFLTLDGVAASTSTDAQLAVLLDGTSLARTAAGVKIADGGVNAAQLAAGVAGNGIAGGAGTTLSVKPKAAGGIIVDVDGVSIDPSVLEFLPLDGTAPMTGDLTLFGAPTEDLHAATKLFVETTAAAAAEAGEEAVARLNKSHFLYDGSSASSLSHVVTHNIGQRFCAVTVCDASGSVVIPDSITFTDENSLTVTFASAMTCYVAVVGIADAPAA